MSADMVLTDEQVRFILVELECSTGLNAGLGNLAMAEEVETVLRRFLVGGVDEQTRTALANREVAVLLKVADSLTRKIESGDIEQHYSGCEGSASVVSAFEVVIDELQREARELDDKTRHVEASKS